MKRILVAGIGNIFLGDDCFGCEVAQQLASRKLPEGVEAKDFGTRSYDLAYALAEPYDLIVLVDATARGEAPGTTYLIEIDLGSLEKLGLGVADAHSMNPVNALRMAQAVGSITAKLMLVGCEPGRLETDDGQMGPSESVQGAVPRAIEMIAELVSREMSEEIKNEDVQVFV